MAGFGDPAFIGAETYPHWLWYCCEIDTSPEDIWITNVGHRGRSDEAFWVSPFHIPAERVRWFNRDGMNEEQKNEILERLRKEGFEKVVTEARWW